MSLPSLAQPATSGTVTRKELRNASILTLVAERLAQASSLARALPADWRDGCGLPTGAQQVIAREMQVLSQLLSARRRA
ncbi:MAG TPA: hypothetical protein VHT52_11410 [Stellaceae bacterium]|nr:hypothetical protein [Stellaceae bacterium]